MARRMFDSKVVNSDPFLAMPVSSQVLYFHLGMHADDHGFVYPRQIMRMIGAAEDDLGILIAKKFIIPHDSGVVIVKHWNVNNVFRSDRRAPTTHLAAAKTVALDKAGVYHAVGDMDAASTTLKERKKEIKNSDPLPVDKSRLFPMKPIEQVLRERDHHE